MKSVLTPSIEISYNFFLLQSRINCLMTNKKLSHSKMTVFFFKALHIMPEKAWQFRRIFQHENQIYPPYFSQNYSILLGYKSKLLSKCLEPKVKPADNSPVVDALIVDVSVVVNALRPGTSHTFHDYVNDVFLPYLGCQMERVKRTFHLAHDKEKGYKCLLFEQLIQTLSYLQYLLSNS